LQFLNAYAQAYTEFPGYCLAPPSALLESEVQSVKETTMKPSTKDQAEGTLHEVKGKIKEKIGRATNNPDREAEGQGEKVAGKIQKKVGQVEKVFEK